MEKDQKAALKQLSTFRDHFAKAAAKRYEMDDTTNKALRLFFSDLEKGNVYKAIENELTAAEILLIKNTDSTKQAAKARLSTLQASFNGIAEANQSKRRKKAKDKSAEYTIYAKKVEEIMKLI